ncbi:MAG: hypothetical protein R3346_02980 [Candidatus Spechtbacterales bacterium]|nr:hypothetical protein [Candidatus Spechtbacterales bacterium]
MIFNPTVQLIMLVFIALFIISLLIVNLLVVIRPMKAADITRNLTLSKTQKAANRKDELIRIALWPAFAILKLQCWLMGYRKNDWES